MKDNKSHKRRFAFYVAASLVVCWLLALLGPSPRKVTQQISQYVPSVTVNYRTGGGGGGSGNSKKLALLVEPRPLGHLAALLVHQMQVVPADWRFLFIGSDASVARLNASLPVRQLVDAGRLVLRRSPLDGHLGRDEVVSRLLMDEAFYRDHVLPAEFLFNFNSDSIICSRANVTLDDWLEYDFITEPGVEARQRGGNGGMSLRRVSKTLEMLAQNRADKTNSLEAAWFAAHFRRRPAAARGADAEAHKLDAAAFVVEDQWRDLPFAYHIGPESATALPGIWDDFEQRRKILGHCKEVEFMLPMKFGREKCEEKEKEEKEEKEKEEKEKEEKEEVEGKEDKEEEEEEEKEEKEQGEKKEKEDKDKRARGVSKLSLRM